MNFSFQWLCLITLICLTFLNSCKLDSTANEEKVKTEIAPPKKKVEKKVTPKEPVNSAPIRINESTANQKIDYKRVNISLMEALVHEEINKARNANGRGSLQNDRILRKAAEDQNNYCLRNTDLTHYQTTPGKETIKDRVQYYGTGYTIMAENLIYEGFTVRRTNGVISDILTPTYRQLAKTLVVNWMNSPSHRDNILENELKRVGTAAAYNPKNYAVYVTQVFGAK